MQRINFCDWKNLKIPKVQSRVFVLQGKVYVLGGATNGVQHKDVQVPIFFSF